MLKIVKGKDGNVVWKVNKNQKKYQYIFRKKSAQGNLIAKLIFKDFTAKPLGLSQNGYGFRGPSKQIFYLLKDNFSHIEEIIVANHQSKIKGKKIHINKTDYEAITVSLGSVQKENSRKLKDAALLEMAHLFPKKFNLKSKQVPYTTGTLAKILSKKGVANQLSDDDIAKVVEIVPTLMERSAKAKKGLLSQIQFADIQNKSTGFELKKILTEYEGKLKKTTQKEEDWQVFFEKNMLFINSAYIKLIEKKNINISVSVPDFLLIDQFQFIDVFEIKRPDFEALKFDKDHKNYFWSPAASMAIAQVEKYLYELELNAYAVVSDLKQQRIDVNIIRPRGYVLIGVRSDYNEDAQRSFKILNDSLKNVQVIFFDDLLMALKSKHTLIKKK